MQPLPPVPRIGNGYLQRNCRMPSGAAHQAIDIGDRILLWSGADFAHGPARIGQIVKQLEHVAATNDFAAPHVVNLCGSASLGQQAIGNDHVADVGQVDERVAGINLDRFGTSGSELPGPLRGWV